MSESPWKSNWSTIPPAQVESWSRLLIFIVAMGRKPVHHPFWGEKNGRPKNAQQEKNTGSFFVIQHLGMANRIELNEFVIRISPGGVKCNAFGREVAATKRKKKTKHMKKTVKWIFGKNTSTTKCDHDLDLLRGCRNLELNNNSPVENFPRRPHHLHLALRRISATLGSPCRVREKHIGFRSSGMLRKYFSKMWQWC